MGKLSFGTTGLSYEVRKVDLSSRSAPKCPRCGHTVYFNEEKKALGKSWHAKCFACAVCKKGLDSVNANGHEGEVYCTMCHRREFGPRGYGYAGGASGLSTETSTLDILLGRSRHSSSSSTSSPKSPMSPVERSWSQSVQQQQQPSPQQNGVDKPKVNGQQPAPPQKLVDRDNIECCPRCGRRVYFAEEVKALKRKWHKLCFKCAQCEKMLDAGRCSSHQGEVYCQACYSRSFGPQGYGYGNQTGGNIKSYRAYKSATLPSKASANYRFSNETMRTDMNGAKREWTDHTEDIRYMKQLAAELDQFE